MIFAGKAAATKANILFDTGGSANFVSKSFTKQTGINGKASRLLCLSCR
jgi:hypothetical protein